MDTVRETYMLVLKNALVLSAQQFIADKFGTVFEKSQKVEHGLIIPKSNQIVDLTMEDDLHP